MDMTKGTEMQTAQTLIDTLDRQLHNQKRALERGDVKSSSQYKAMIAETLKALEALGYDADDCLKACGE